jgi:hypothetical protein
MRPTGTTVVAVIDLAQDYLYFGLPTAVGLIGVAATLLHARKSALMFGRVPAAADGANSNASNESLEQAATYSADVAKRAAENVALMARQATGALLRDLARREVNPLIELSRVDALAAAEGVSVFAVKAGSSATISAINHDLPDGWDIRSADRDAEGRVCSVRIVRRNSLGEVIAARDLIIGYETVQASTPKTE